MLTVSELRYLQFGPFSFELEAGECLGLMGPSGAGKTRMLRSLADLDPHLGEIRLAGQAAHEMLPPQWRRRVGYLPAESHWWSDRVGDHFPGRGGDGTATIAPDVLGLAPDVLGWDVARLSTGERHRLALLRLLCNAPQVLLLDEPTSGLDQENVERVEALVGDLRRESGTAVLWVSHDPAQLGRIATRSLVLADGRLEPRA